MVGVKIMRYFKTQTGSVRAIDEGQGSLIQDDWLELTSLPPSQHHTAIIENGEHAGWEITPENAQAAFKAKQSQLESEIQSRLDQFARTRNYDGILSAASYATSTNTKFATEGQHCVQLRDDTWAAAYAILGEVEQGARPEPDGIADFEGELPAMDWPS